VKRLTLSPKRLPLLLKHLKKVLSRPRYRHTMSVAKFARQLAKKYRVSEDQAYTAGLLHDLAKEWPHRKLLWHAKRYLHLPHLSDFKRAPHLLHAYVSADLARRKWKVRNRFVLKAISGHTLGNKSMNALDKIIYVADLSSPDRKFKGARAVRRKAAKSLDEAFLQSLALKIQYVIKGRSPLHHLTVNVWNAWV
jgi:predicted HD superfamily hydrolase involved in NAD metabolism